MITIERRPMDSIPVFIKDQPDHTSCGPTSLHAIYHYYEDDISLAQVISEISQFDEGGGTFGVDLGEHALKKGYDVTIYTYNINIFDPTWFPNTSEKIAKFLSQRLEGTDLPIKEKMSIEKYLEFIALGGIVRMEELTESLLLKYLKMNVPILTGLSSTWLYQAPRENQMTNEDDPILGTPSGHFVIIRQLANQKADICDPYRFNPISNSNYYQVTFDRLRNAILLGISSFDGNLVLIRKKSE